MANEKTRYIDFDISTDEEEVYMRKKIKKHKLNTDKISIRAHTQDFLSSNNSYVCTNLNDYSTQIAEEETGELI